MQAADENGSDGLDVDEFRAAFGQILGKGKKDQQVWVSISLTLYVWCGSPSPSLSMYGVGLAAVLQPALFPSSLSHQYIRVWSVYV